MRFGVGLGLDEIQSLRAVGKWNEVLVGWLEGGYGRVKVRVRLVWLGLGKVFEGLCCVSDWECIGCRMSSVSR